MSNVVPIWTPRDAIDTAQDFHLEIANAERGVEVIPAGRPRPRIVEAIGVTLLMLVMAVFGCAVVLLSAPHAKADPDPDAAVVAFAAHYGSAVCETLDDFPSSAGILGVGEAIHDQGLSYRQAGQVIWLSVDDICPRHRGLVDRFARDNAQARSVA